MTRIELTVSRVIRCLRGQTLLEMRSGEAALPESDSSTIVRRIAAAFFELVQSLIEVVADAGPAEFDQKDQDRDRNRSDDENRLQADGASFVAVNLAEQIAKCDLRTHLTVPCRYRFRQAAVESLSRTGQRLRLYIIGHATSVQTIS